MEPCDGPQRGDAERKKHGLNEQPQETNVVTSITCQDLPEDECPENCDLDLDGAANMSAATAFLIHDQS